MKIAVIGSGISGLGSALLLSQKHEVHLFESESRLGGHAHTSNINISGSHVDVDTGFLVYNELTYPHLTAMFKYLGVETVASDMSLSIQSLDDGIEWSGDSLTTVFAQKKNILNWSFLKMLQDILKLEKKAEEWRIESADKRWSVGDLLRAKKINDSTQRWYLLPMLAAIWSTPEKDMLNFPAETFLTFFINHRLLQINNRPVWRTVKNGSINYVNKIAQKLEHIHLSESVSEVVPVDAKIELATNKSKYSFDKVVFATSVPIAKKILKNPTSDQGKLLNSIETESNRAILHMDSSFMPRHRKCWSSWNAQATLSKSSKVSLTYFLNRLQPLNTPKDLLLTLNPEKKIADPLFEHTYHHPRFDQKAIDAQKNIENAQGQNGVYFAGAWTRYGFHEDGLLSAVRVAKHFNINTPWGIDG